MGGLFAEVIAFCKLHPANHAIILIFSGIPADAAVTGRSCDVVSRICVDRPPPPAGVLHPPTPKFFDL